MRYVFGRSERVCDRIALQLLETATSPFLLHGQDPGHRFHAMLRLSEAAVIFVSVLGENTFVEAIDRPGMENRFPCHAI